MTLSPIDGAIPYIDPDNSISNNEIILRSPKRKKESLLVESDSASFPLKKRKLDKLSSKSFKNVENWRSFFSIHHPNQQIKEEQFQRYIQSLEVLQSSIYEKFDEFLNVITLNIPLLNSLEIICISGYESIDSFADIVLHKDLNAEISKNVADLLYQFPFYSETITNSASLYLNKNNDFIFKTIIDLSFTDTQIKYIELVNDLENHHNGEEILKTLFLHKEKDSYFLDSLILVLREWMPLDDVEQLSSLVLLSLENPQVILVLADLIRKDRQVLSFLFQLKADPQTIYSLLINIHNYGLDVGPPSLLGDESKEVLVKTILNTPESLQELCKIEGLSPEVFSKLLLIMNYEHNSKEIPEDLKKFTFLLNLPGSLTLKFKSKILELVNRSVSQDLLYLDFAITLVKFYLEDPKNNNAATSFARVALEASSSEWLNFFFEEYAHRNERIVFSFMQGLLNYNYEGAVIAFHRLYQKDPQALIIQACLHKFIEHKGKLPTPYRALLIASQDGNEHQEYVGILLSIIAGKEEELTVQQYAAKMIMIYDGDIYSAMRCLEMPDGILPDNLMGLEYKIFTNAWLSGRYNDIQIFLEYMSKIISNLRHIDYSKVTHLISEKANLLVQSYQKFLPTQLPYQPENIYLCKMLTGFFTNEYGVIFADSLYALLKTEALQKKFKESEIAYILKQVTQLIHDPRIKILFEALTFDGNQQGPLALLIRSTWGLSKNHVVTDTDLIKTALFAYIHFPFVVQNKCVGVSLLQTLFMQHPDRPLYWLQELVTHEKIEFSSKNYKEIIFPNIVPNMAFLDVAVPFHSSDKEFLFSNELAAYFGIPQDKVSVWLQKAFEQCAKQTLCSKNDTLNLPCRMVIKALADNAPLFSRTTLEGSNLEFEAAIFIAGMFEPLPSRMLESVILTFDKSPLNAFKISLQHTVAEILKNDEDKPESINNIKIFKKIFNTQLDTSAAVYFNTDIYDTKRGHNTIISPESFKFDNPQAITTEQQFKEFSLLLIQKTLDEIANNLSGDKAEFIILAEKLRQSIDADYASICTNHFRNYSPLYKKCFPWAPLSGADVRIQNRISNKMMSPIKRACSNAQQLTLLLAEYANKYSIDTPEYAHRGFVADNHISNLIFDHPSMAGIADCPDAKDFFDKHQQQAEALNELSIDEKDYRDWCTKVGLLLPALLKNRWEKSVEESSEGNFTLGEAFQSIYSNLLELCGSSTILRNTLMPELESLIYTYLISKGHNHRFLHFAKTNWFEPSSAHYALWVSPGTLEWKIWQMDEKEQRIMKDYYDFFANKFEFWIL